MESFSKNIKQEMFNTHISSVSGKDVSVMICVSEKTELEIISMNKKIKIDLETNDPEEIVGRVCEVLKNIDLTIVEHGEPCYDIYYSIEREDISYLRDIFVADNIKFDFENCSVCYCASVWETSCHHSLCLICFPKCKKCPLCRTIL